MRLRALHFALLFGYSGSEHSRRDPKFLPRHARGSARGFLSVSHWLRRFRSPYCLRRGHIYMFIPLLSSFDFENLRLEWLGIFKIE